MSESELGESIKENAIWYCFYAIIISAIIFAILLPSFTDHYSERREVAQLYSDTLALRLKIDEKIKLKQPMN